MTEVAGHLSESRQRRFRPYPAYKDPGIEWLGEIPAHWQVQRLKYVATLNDEALPEATDPGFEMTYVDIASVDAVAGITSTEIVMFDKAPSRARRIVRHGDVIISTVRTYLRAITAIQRSEPNLIVSTGFAVIRPRQLESSFASYALRAPHFVERVVANSVGVSYPAINANSLACFELAYPNADEQRAIAAFLDRETAKIDALVAKKERLVELLQEKRTALITRAVTRGLDLSVRTKNSGFHWMGEVPAHWKVRRLKDQGALIGGAGFPHDYQGLNDQVLPFYKVGDLSASSDGRYMRSAPNTVSLGVAKELRAQVIPPNSIIYAKIGAALLLNRRRVTTVPCCIDNNVSAYVPGRELTTEWALHWTTTVDFGAFAHPGAVPSLSEGDQADIPIVVPPLAEQHTIAIFLNEETARINRLIARVRGATDYLKEYRTALISAAVTGKIDVRKEVG